MESICHRTPPHVSVFTDSPGKIQGSTALISLAIFAGTPLESLGLFAAGRQREDAQAFDAASHLRTAKIHEIHKIHESMKPMKFIQSLSLLGCVFTMLPPAGAQSAPAPPKASAPVWSIGGRQNLDRELDAVFWFRKQFIALGREMQPGGPVGVVARSTEGYDWEYAHPADAPKSEIFSAASNDNILVVLPWDRISFLSSTDGTQWKKTAMPRNMLDGEQAMVYSVIFGDQEFIASGQSGTILGSPDGKTWTLRRPALRGEPHLFSIAWNGQYYLAPYGKDKVLVSSNGRDWKVNNAPGAPEKGSIAWTGKKFMVVDAESRQFESEQGLDWRHKTADLGCARDGLLDVRKIFHAQNTLLVIGRCLEKSGTGGLSPRGLFAVSNDEGVSWVNTARETYMRDASFSPELKRFLAAGYKRIASSSPYKEEAFVRSQ
jgi:hypothetical protein